jgi:protein SCO1/2
MAGLRRWRAVCLALLCLSLLVACSKAATQFDSIDLTGADYAKDFHLTDTAGKPRTLADYHGKVVLLFFGYTQCPDVCPTTMADLKNVMQTLGPDADRVQVLFVTLDPVRDTPDLLGQYVPGFDPRFVGLRAADEAATAQTAKDFKVFYQKVDGKTPDGYTIDHTAGTYVFDADGHVRLFIKQGLSAQAISHDVKLLLG